MLTAVEGKLGSLKMELVQALHSCFVATDLDVDRVSSRLDELNKLNEDVGKLTESISCEVRQTLPKSCAPPDCPDRHLP